MYYTEKITMVNEIGGGGQTTLGRRAGGIIVCSVLWLMAILAVMFGGRYLLGLQAGSEYDVTLVIIELIGIACIFGLVCTFDWFVSGD